MLFRAKLMCDSAPPTSHTPASLNRPSFCPPGRHIHQPLPLPTCPATQLMRPAPSPTRQLMGQTDQSHSHGHHTPASGCLQHPIDAFSTQGCVWHVWPLTHASYASPTMLDTLSHMTSNV